jgi:L-ascorbate metabolism protein UlaG (beta-lactamase superfamily)
MNGKLERRSFFKRAFAASAMGAGSLLTGKNALASNSIESIPGQSTGILPMENPDYSIGRFKNRITIQYVGLSCFVITSSKGVKIITDPYLANDKNVLHSQLRKEPADVLTVSCGSYAHCHVFDVGGTPFIYKITKPTVLHGITFRGVATRHLKMPEVATIDAGDNVVMCFEVDGIKICHLGALGHKLTDEQVKQIGKVDILMVPVNGVSALPVADAREVCKQINPQIIFPMHYCSERMVFPEWATAEDFLSDRKVRSVESEGHTKKYYENVLWCNYNVGSDSLEFILQADGTVKMTSPGANDQISAKTMNVIVPRYLY